MRQRDIEKLDAELSSFCGEMFEGMGRRERKEAMRLYVGGLLLDGDRKSVEPMAQRLAKEASGAEALRQRLQQCVSISAWDDEEMLRRLASKLDRELPDLEALIIDDTGFPKQGKHSVGVARQYSGTLGRTANCQVAVSLSLSGEKASACLGLSLFLPDAWVMDRDRRRAVGVPDELLYRTKGEIALERIDAALQWGVRRHVVLADAGYGDSRDFREELSARGLKYVVGVSGSHTVWPPGSNPTRPARLRKAGRPRTRHVDEESKPISVKALASQLVDDGYLKVTWRAGSKGPMSSHFAAVRIRSAERHTKGRPPGIVEWLLCEWPRGESGPTKFYLSTLPETTTLKELVRIAKLRWRVERDFQELKGELGLDHFEGRTWRGFHHHATLCCAAYGFLALRRALFPPIDPNDLDRLGTRAPSDRPDPPRWKMPSVPPRRRQTRVPTRAAKELIG